MRSWLYERLLDLAATCWDLGDWLEERAARLVSKRVRVLRSPAPPLVPYDLGPAREIFPTLIRVEANRGEPVKILRFPAEKVSSEPPSAS